MRETNEFLEEQVKSTEETIAQLEEQVINSFDANDKVFCAYSVIVAKRLAANNH